MTSEPSLRRAGICSRTYDPLGVALARQGRYEEAEAAFRHALRSPEPERAGAALNLGLLYLRQGRYADAIPLLRAGAPTHQRAAIVRPSLALALSRRAEELAREGRNEEAEALQREAAALGAAEPDGSRPSSAPPRARP